MTNLTQGPSAAAVSTAPQRKSWRLAGTGLVLVGLGFGVFYFYGHHTGSSVEAATAKVATTGQSQMSPVSAVLPPSAAPKAATVADRPESTVLSLSAAKALATSSSSGKNPDYLGGQEAIAKVRVAGKDYVLEPNQTGNFGRILIAAETDATIQVTYPQANVGDPIQIESEDGGVLDTKEVVKTGTLSDGKLIDFHFVSGIQEGIYRLTLRQGSDLKQIDFWVGPEIPVRKLNSTTTASN